MTALRRIETVAAALAFFIGIAWPLAEIALHAAR
jgi:hypothetical protein